MSAAAAVPAPQTWPQVAIVNDASSGVSDADAEAMVAAVAKQVLDDFGPRWNAGAHFSFVPSTQKPPAGKWCVTLLDSSDQAGALGYHDLTPDGLPLGKVFAGTDRQYGSSVSVTLSHEVLEMLADPWIALAAQGPDGKFYAWESADAVEDDSLGYEIDGIKVSAFVTPAWFGTGDTAAGLTYPNVPAMTKPLQLIAGGYISVFDPASGQGWTQSQAQQAPIVQPDAETVADARRDAFHALPRVGSRRERRFRGRSAWVRSVYTQG